MSNNCVGQNFDSTSISSNGHSSPKAKNVVKTSKSEGDITSPFVNNEVEIVAAEVSADGTLINYNVVDDIYNNSNSNTLLLTPSTSALSEGPSSRKNEDLKKIQKNNEIYRYSISYQGKYYKQCSC